MSTLKGRRVSLTSCWRIPTAALATLQSMLLLPRQLYSCLPPGSHDGDRYSASKRKYIQSARLWPYGGLKLDKGTWKANARQTSKKTRQTHTMAPPAVRTAWTVAGAAYARWSATVATWPDVVTGRRPADPSASASLAFHAEPTRRTPASEMAKQRFRGVVSTESTPHTLTHTLPSDVRRVFSTTAPLRTSHVEPKQ